MTKIVYNACYGGFSLSFAAVRRAREISGNSNWGGPAIEGDLYESGEPVENVFGMSLIRDVPWHDPVLVQVVEELGQKASGRCADLRIEEIPAGSKYRIDEYDGNEKVATPDSYEWEVAP